MEKPSLFARIGALLKGKWLLWAAGLLGALLLLLPTGKEEKTREGMDAEEYRLSLCASVEALCEEVKGVGNATVLLTLSSGECAVYEKNVSTSGESVATAGSEALLVGYKPPSVAGVAVVCEGGANEEVRAELVRLLSAALSVSSARIYVAPSK